MRDERIEQTPDRRVEELEREIVPNGIARKNLRSRILGCGDGFCDVERRKCEEEENERRRAREQEAEPEASFSSSGEETGKKAIIPRFSAVLAAASFLSFWMPTFLG